MENTTARPKTELRTLIGVASQIARRGYGEPIVDLALRRKGVTRDAARLIAASVVSCHATLILAEEQSRLEQARIDATHNTHNTHKANQRAAKAASLMLTKMMSFVVFIVIGLGGGALLGWSVGFNLGIDEGFEWIVRVIERRISG